MSDSGFISATYEVQDALEANELFQRNGWTDGLPIIAPTERAVSQFLDVVRLKPADQIGVEPVRRRAITAEKVAIAAVMAGCLPEYMPVIVALARLAFASALCELFIPNCVRIGPFTISIGALPPVLAVQPCMPNSGLHIA